MVKFWSSALLYFLSNQTRGELKETQDRLLSLGAHNIKLIIECFVLFSRVLELNSVRNCVVRLCFILRLDL